MRNKPEVKIDRMGDRDSTSHMKEQFQHFNSVRQEWETKRIEMNHQKIMKGIDNDRIIKEYGNYTELLPDELKIYGKDKSYKQGPIVHKVDPTLILKNTKAIQEGKIF